MTAETTAPARELRIEIEGFEGPLDLLLHLIQKHELDILDIPISFITEEYLAYLDTMEALDLAIAGEYLVMAATLLHIKSKLLLPAAPSDDDPGGDGTDGGDPREELVRRLLAYQRYRDAADHLGGREITGRDVFTRPSRAERFREQAGPGTLLPVDLFHLLDAFRRVAAARPAAAVHEVSPEAMSIRQTILLIADHLDAHPRATLTELVYLHGPEPTRIDVVVTFLALLEMAKLRLVRLLQARLTATDLFVERAVLDHAEVALRLEGLGEDTP
ncbi:MAG: segregation/condensation protein A [Myxococcales bacterium]|nr:segregation/condensation protein A [Myxococcales bacterium]MCB9533616.1 segregation/condensation protein A [Myxococcales bacterium]